MDSGNSGSMQSSSTGGDEEYDSRADTSSISAFLNNNVPPPQPTTTFAPFTHHVLDPLSSNYSDPTQRSHMLWPNVARSEPDPPHSNQAFLLTQFGGQSQPRGTLSNVGVGVGGAHAFHTTTTLPPESDEQNSTNTNTNVNSNNMVRNPKKRSRASRRAPTTVLTTDTTNFRAMVQEFTGIPAPPFTSSPFPRTRLDLFASSSSTMRSTSAHNLDPSTPPPYLLRPFAHKVQSQPSSIPPMLDTLASNISNSNSYHPLNMHNPILSLLQPPPKYPQQQPSLEIPQSGVGFEELGLSHAHVGNAAHHHHNINNNMRAPSSEAWAQAQAQAQRIGNNDGGVLRSLSGAGTLNGKVNYSSDFHGEKGPDCAVAARSEGMVESWINCSSD